MEEIKPKKKRKYIYLILFIVTLITTTIAGAEWMYGKFLVFSESRLSFAEILTGIYFSFPFLAILTVHEFGHYFTARYYKIKVTLPYYIPLWLGFIAAPSIGTMGAFIRIKEAIKSRKEYFDVGIAGPLAGFVMALFILYYGFNHLPPSDYIYKIHPEYEQYGSNYAKYVYNEKGTVYLGGNLTIWFFENYVAPDPDRIPNMYEMYHYPWVFAGFLALFFTALNLLPIGQLDGGHVLYGLFGWENHRMISFSLFVLFLFYAGLGLITPWDPLSDLILYIPLYVGFLYISLSSVRAPRRTRLMIAMGIFAVQFFLSLIFPTIQGYPEWLLMAFIIGRFLGLYHPPALMDEPLSPTRKVLGWIALLVFVVSFSPRPFMIV